MTRGIAYLQYSSQNFKKKRDILHPNWTGPVPEMTFEFNGTNQLIPAIYFYIVLNKNWKYLMVWTIIKGKLRDFLHVS
jgi:hypothetical protein